MSSLTGNLTYDSATGNLLINSTAGVWTTIDTSTLNTPYTTTCTTSYPYTAINTLQQPYYVTTDYGFISNPLKNLKYIIDFDHNIDRFDLLEDQIKGIRKNKILFNCKYDGNRIQPYELIMKLIHQKKKFTVKVKVSDILTITYINFQFKEIINNLNFNTECDFSELKVKFQYDEILYENHKLSEKELRTDKLKKILENQE